MNTDLFIQASNYEGLPHSLLEAMSFGIPVLCTPVGDCKEILGNEDRGYMLDLPVSQENIKSKIAKIINEKDIVYFFKNIYKINELELINYCISHPYFTMSEATKYKINKSNKNSTIYINVDSKIYNFKINNNLIPYKDNILASIAVCKSLNIIDQINNNFFLNYKIPGGRGNIKKFTFGSKKLNIIDESYNSNPLSLSFSIRKFDNLKINPKKNLCC